jgi:hypothetical protein
MCGAEVCGGLGDVDGVNASVDAKAVGVWVCVCLQSVVLMVVLCVCVSLTGNDLGGEGGVVFPCPFEKSL